MSRIRTVSARADPATKTEVAPIRNSRRLNMVFSLAQSELLRAPGSLPDPFGSGDAPADMKKTRDPSKVPRYLERAGDSYLPVAAYIITWKISLCSMVPLTRCENGPFA